MGFVRKGRAGEIALSLFRCMEREMAGPKGSTAEVKRECKVSWGQKERKVRLGS